MISTTIDNVLGGAFVEMDNQKLTDVLYLENNI